MVISNSLLLIEVVKEAERWREMEINIPEAAKLDIRGPVVEVEGVEILDKDGTQLAVVKEMDRPVVEKDLDGAGTEADEPEDDGDPPGESRTVAPLTIKPWLILV